MARSCRMPARWFYRGCDPAGTASPCPERAVGSGPRRTPGLGGRPCRWWGEDIEPRRREVVIEREGRADACTPHRAEARVIHERDPARTGGEPGFLGGVVELRVDPEHLDVGLAGGTETSEIGDGGG